MSWSNAGYALVGAVEELSEQELRDELETNLFGVLHVTQAVLPVLREQGSGRILQISSVAGLTAMAGLGGYHTSKWALEGMSEALAQEVAPFGIHVTIVEPGGFATNFKDAAVYTAHAKGDYEQLHASLREQGETVQLPGADGVGAAILELVDAEQPPLRVLFGEQAAQYVPAVYEQRLGTWAEWAHVSKMAEGT